MLNLKKMNFKFGSKKLGLVKVGTKLGESFGWVLGMGKGSFGNFNFFVSLVLILLDLLGFWSNLNAFMSLLLNKWVHETLKHNFLNYN